MRTHPCPGCGRDGIACDRFACPSCWHRLPEELRHRITSAWMRSAHDPRARDDHAVAMVDARQWYAERAAEDRARPIGERRTGAGGEVMEWTGALWRHVTAAELDREAWRRAAAGEPQGGAR